MIPSFVMIKKLIGLFCLLLATLFFCGSIVAEEPEVAADIFKAKEKQEKILFGDLFRTRSRESFTGVMLANILIVDPQYRYLYIKPQEENLPRITVYLDKYTAFTKMKVGKLSRGSKKLLLEGDRIAVRVFIREGIVLADEVFLVDGEFGPKARFAKRKYTGSIKAGGAAPKKAKGGHN